MAFGRAARLSNAASAAPRPPASPLFAVGPGDPGVSLRRGVLVSVPVGLSLAVELGLGAPSKGAIGTGALLVGFAGLDTPARTRAAWQLVAAPAVALAAALGALTGSWPALAIPALALVGAAAGYCFSVSLRFAILAQMTAMAMLIVQGLPIGPADAPEALLWALGGGLLQAGFSFCVWVARGRRSEEREPSWNADAARQALAANLTLSSPNLRHAVRLGAGLAGGVALYWLLDMRTHGFWIPMAILFILRPDRGVTSQRSILRAVGTAVGLILATALSYWLHDDGVALALALTVATALAYGLRNVQYALFSAAITTYAVLLADTLGEPALAAAGQRAGATALGIGVALATFLLWPNPGEGRWIGAPRGHSAPPEAAAR